MRRTTGSAYRAWRSAARLRGCDIGGREGGGGWRAGGRRAMRGAAGRARGRPGGSRGGGGGAGGGGGGAPGGRPRRTVERHFNSQLASVQLARQLANRRPVVVEVADVDVVARNDPQQIAVER